MQQTFTRLANIYSTLPINFSSLTGWRYPFIPRLMGNPFLGRLPHLLARDGVLNNLLTAGDLATKHPSGMCYYWVANKLILLITKPEHIHQLLITNNNNISRDSAYKVLSLFLGPNITVDEKPEWKLKKEVYSDWLFKPDMLEQHEPKMCLLVNDYINKLNAKQYQSINLQNLFASFTLDILLNTVLLPHNNNANHCLEKLLAYQEQATDNLFEFRSIFKLLLPSLLRRFLFKGKLQNPSEVKCSMRKNFNEILLAPNEQEIKTTNNFINSIYQLSENQAFDKLIDDTNVFGDTNMLMLAGQETSIATFQFVIKLLCANPIVEARLREELQMIFKDNEFSIDNINKITYLDMILKETLRLFPPVPFLPRDVIKRFTIGDVTLSKGDIVIFSPYLTHHLSTIWEQPEKFEPERFNKNIKLIPQAYIPFGAGQNMCIGQRFAWQEIKLFLAALYLNFHIEMVDNDFQVSLTQGALKPKTIPLARLIAI